MLFDRLLDNAELGCDLLVHPSRDDPRENFALTRRELLESLAHRLPLPGQRERFAIPIERLSDTANELVFAERLGEEFDGAAFHGSDTHWNRTVPSEKNDRNVDSGTRQILRELEATA